MDEKLPASARERIASSLSAKLLQVIDDGAGPVTGARSYADSRMEKYGDSEASIRRIVRETIGASGTTGFVTGLGGFITLPVAIPANITGQAILNARMVGAIAHLRGWDLSDEVVRNMILVAVAGGHPNAVLAEFGVTVGRRMTETAIRRVPIAVIRKINARVGFMLIAKYGTKRSVVTLAKGVPLVGGVIGGGVDAGFTKAVSTLAKRSFPVVDAPGAAIL